MLPTRLFICQENLNNHWQKSSDYRASFSIYLGFFQNKIMVSQKSFVVSDFPSYIRLSNIRWLGLPTYEGWRITEGLLSFWFEILNLWKNFAKNYIKIFVAPPVLPGLFPIRISTQLSVNNSKNCEKPGIIKFIDLQILTGGAFAHTFTL